MGVGFGLPTPAAILKPNSRKINPQSTGLASSSAPNIVLAMVIVTRVGLSAVL